jgi:putative copper export protein
MTTGYFIAARAIHFGACLLFFAFLAIDCLVVGSILERETQGTDRYWRSRIQRFVLVLLLIILISGFAWFVLVAMNMSGEPPQINILKIVWSQTRFGTVWKVRLIVWIASVTAVLLVLVFNPRKTFPKKLTWFLLVTSAVLLGSLAWAGHGQEDSPWHLVADVLHLVVAGFWPAGLLPFALLLRHLRADLSPAVIQLVRRFSAISLGSVAALALTGIVNARYLVISPSNLINLPYGRWLLLKIILFCIALGFGAVNLLRLKPRLQAEGISIGRSDRTLQQLRSNVQYEIYLAMVIVIVVAVLGTLPPAAD